MVMAREEEVEAKVAVREKRRDEEDVSESRAGSQAVIMPPRLPSASLARTPESAAGRMEPCLKTSREASLDSWRQRTAGEAATTALLSWHPTGSPAKFDCDRVLATCAFLQTTVHPGLMFRA